MSRESWAPNSQKDTPLQLEKNIANFGEPESWLIAGRPTPFKIACPNQRIILFKVYARINFLGLEMTQTSFPYALCRHRHPAPLPHPLPPTRLPLTPHVTFPLSCPVFARRRLRMAHPPLTKYNKHNINYWWVLGVLRSLILRGWGSDPLLIRPQGRGSTPPHTSYRTSYPTSYHATQCHCGTSVPCGT